MADTAAFSQNSAPPSRHSPASDAQLSLPVTE